MTVFYRLSGALATMSFFGAAVVMLTYSFMPDLRKHPTNMVFFLSLCDSLLSLKFMVTAAYPGSDKLENIGTPSCYLQAGWAQFFGIGSIAWNGMISLNLIINLQKQGFARTSSLGKYYQFAVWGLALATTAVMYSDPKRIGPSGDGTCWVASNHDPFRLLFFIPLLFFFALSLASLVLCFLRTQGVAGLSDASRRGVVLRMSVYTGVFLLCWSGPLAHRIYLLASTNEEEGPESLKTLDACGIAIQGFANAMVWLTNPSFFVPFKKRILDKYLGCSFNSTHEQSPLLHNLQEGLQDSKQDINRIDTLLRRNIITCILLGIRQSLKEPAQQMEVTPKSYQEQKRYEYSKLYSSERELAGTSEGYEFVDYAPYVFARLRAQAGISPEDYMEAMRPSHFLGTVLQDQLQKFSEGRSDSFFIFSPDRRFILKTLKAEEATLLLHILPNLHQYFIANPATLLPKFFGCHGVQMPHGQAVYVIVMGNVFQSPVEIHEQYDLKGSWVNRYAGLDKPDAPKKKAGMDRDLTRKLKLPRKQQFLDQVSKDAMFLCSLNIMDYSLLLGFNFMDRGSLSYSTIEINDLQPAVKIHVRDTPENLMSQVSTDGKEAYFMGVIDILQLYNTQKKAERFFKVYFLWKDKQGLSSMPPHAYARRFIQAMHKIVE